jgi:hypothetical protein
LVVLAKCHFKRIVVWYSNHLDRNFQLGFSIFFLGLNVLPDPVCSSFVRGTLIAAGEHKLAIAE